MTRRYCVELSPQALDDLGEIGAFIAAGSPAEALRFVKKLRAAAMKLDHLPLRKPVAPEGTIDGHTVHQLEVGRYRILFTVHDRHVHIEGVRHARRLPRA